MPNEVTDYPETPDIGFEMAMPNLGETTMIETNTDTQHASNVGKPYINMTPTMFTILTVIGSLITAAISMGLVPSWAVPIIALIGNVIATLSAGPRVQPPAEATEVKPPNPSV